MNKQNKIEKQTHSYGEQTNGCQRRRELEGEKQRGRRLRSTNFQLQINHRDVIDSITENRDNTMLTMYGDRWLLDLLW